MSVKIFETRDLLIRHEDAGNKRRCVVSFSSFTDEPRLDRPGFGESFLLERGIDAIFVINRTNVWYQYPEMPQALEAIRAFVAPYAEVFTYGSSMGGYAAIRFAEAIGATTAIAISPQYSIAPRVVRFDKRWRAIARRIEFLHEKTHAASQVTAPLIFYDPRDRDARHFELIQRAYPRTKGVRLWHAGHPAGAYLSDTGVLSAAIEAVFDGALDVAALERTVRARRRMSGQYLFTLARRLPPWRWETKMRLAAMAVERREDAAHLIYLSIVIERRGELDAAERHLRRAAEVLPEHPAPMRALCGFLLRRARFGEAKGLAEKLVAIDPDRDDYARFLRMALFGTGDFERLPDEMRRHAAAASRQKWSPRTQFAVRRMELAERWGVENACFATIRPWELFRLGRKIALREELKLFEEWRRPDWRKWRIFRRARAAATLLAPGSRKEP